jgi:tRNA (guanine26-N2/guanine27-N2)-dimethyltransferase
MIKKQVLKLIKEGKSDIFVFKNKESNKGPGSKEGLPFYNPSMELNRDISIVLCQWLINKNNRKVELLDGLASSGIRGIRFSNELDGDFHVTINDWESYAYDLIKKNVEKLNKKNISVSDVNLNTLLSQKKFDYIDIDPFGSPVFFIDSAVRSIKNYGIIGCTATDTAALCGTYPKVCFRRYGAVPFNSVVMKEIALRILLGLICRTAGIYDKGIKPIISYSTDHYFRVYVQIINGTGNANDSMKHFYVIRKDEQIGINVTKKDIGPLWMNKLQNKRVLKELISILFEKKLGTKNQSWKLLDLIEEEADAPAFFYTTESFASHLKTSPPKLDTVFESLKNNGFEVNKTHFSSTGFKTNAPKKEIEKVFKL